MAYVGKKFPDIDVEAINEMGDKININIFKKAKKERKKILLFWLKTHQVVYNNSN